MIGCWVLLFHINRLDEEFEKLKLLKTDGICAVEKYIYGCPLSTQTGVVKLYCIESHKKEKILEIGKAILKHTPNYSENKLRYISEDGYDYILNNNTLPS